VAAQAHAGGREREWLACLISYAFGQGRGSGGKWARRGGGVETGGLEFTRRRPTTHASAAGRAKDWGGRRRSLTGGPARRGAVLAIVGQIELAGPAR
jgi:hypothetical protein